MNAEIQETYCAQKKPPALVAGGLETELPDKDSNLECLDQNQVCCHYTIGQYLPRSERDTPQVPIS